MNDKSASKFLIAFSVRHPRKVGTDKAGERWEKLEVVFSSDSSSLAYRVHRRVMCHREWIRLFGSLRVLVRPILGHAEYIETWELGTPKRLSKNILNSEVLLFLRTISM